MLFPLASGELRGVPNRDRTATVEYCCFLPWTWTRLQSITSWPGLDGISLLELAPDGERFSKRALLSLALLPYSACITGRLRGIQRSTNLRWSFVPHDHHSSEFREELSKKSSDFTSLGLRCAHRFSQPHGVLFLPMHPKHVSAQSHS